MPVKDDVAKGNPYGSSLGELVEGSSSYERTKHAGAIGALALRVIREAVRPPFAWLRDAVVEFSLAVRRCLVPLVIAHSVYMIGYGILLLGILLINLGISERISGSVFILWSREVATWITAMIFAGVVGSAVAADLGARKVRDELDAMAVLGIKQVRALIVPRVVAMTVGLPVLAFLSLALVQVVNYIVSPWHFGFSHGVFRDNLAQFILPSDLIFTMFLKNFVLGFFIGVVACYKGIACRAGAEGVGRAVNETVIITFFGVWAFNSLFNLAYFALIPEAGVLRG